MLATITAASPVHIPLRLPLRPLREPTALRLRSPAARAAERGATCVTPEVLLRTLNERLGARCAGMRLGGRRWEINELASGCNWSECSLVVRMHGTTPPGAFAALRQVIADARAEFDLIPPPTSAA